MGGETLYLEGEIFRRRLPFSRTKFGKRMGALARRLPALQRHRPITDLKLITRDGRRDGRTYGLILHLCCWGLWLCGAGSAGSLARREHFLLSHYFRISI